MGLNEQSGQFKKNMNDANKAVNDAQKSVGELASSMQDNVFFSRDFADEAKRASKELYGASLNATETTKAFSDVAKAAAGISDDLDKVVSGQASLNDLAKKKAALDKANAIAALEREIVIEEGNKPTASEHIRSRFLHAIENDEDIESVVGDLADMFEEEVHDIYEIYFSPEVA